MKSLMVAAVMAMAIGVCVAAPPRPNISLYFEAKMAIQLYQVAANVTHFGDGNWVIDQPKGKGLEFYVFPHQQMFNQFRLQRYDIGFTYEIDFSNRSDCIVTAVDGSMPIEFGWVSQATYAGQKKYRTFVVDLWTFTTGYASLELGVLSTDANHPVYYAKNTSSFSAHHEFYEFNPIVPADSWFIVPTNCNKTMSEEEQVDDLTCVSRSTMVTRAQSWVTAHVPYNQDATYDGYREDCSGFVSMCWETSKPGYTTYTMHEIAHSITKSELLPGDALLCASEHVVFFGGWANSEHTEYVAYEETRPGEGTVKRTTPYPYWYNTACFIPTRYDSVC